VDYPLLTFSVKSAKIISGDDKMICAIMSNGDELSLKNKNEKDKPYPLIKLQIRNVIWE